MSANPPKIPRPRHPQRGRAYAEFLHTSCGHSFVEACRMADYDPYENEMRSTIRFVVVMASLSMVFGLMVAFL